MAMDSARNCEIGSKVIMDLKFADQSEINTLIQSPNVKNLALLLGDDVEDYVWHNEFGVGLHSPFRVAMNITNWDIQHLPDLINQYWEMIEGIKTCDDLYTVAMRTERAYRPRVLWRLYEEGYYDPKSWPIHEWWDLLEWLWTDSEAMEEKFQYFRSLFALMPTVKSQTRDLPRGAFKVYRGGHPDGFSWTLDRKQAEFFANRFGWEDGRICERVITRSDVLFYTDRRNEKEVILKSIMKETYDV